jgi:hypothetical protein
MPDILAQMLLVVGVVAIGVILTISIRSRIARKDAQRPSAGDRISEAKTKHRLIDDRNAIEAQLHDIARHYASIIDARAERLDQLIVQAEQRIAELSRLATSAARNGRVPDRDAEATDSAARPGARPSDAPAAPHRAEARPAGARSQAGPSRGLDPVTLSVYEMADAGHDPVTIAQALDEQIGKVELILALRQG